MQYESQVSTSFGKAQRKPITWRVESRNVSFRQRRPSPEEGGRTDHNVSISHWNVATISEAQGWWSPRGGGPPGVVVPQGWWSPRGGGPPGVVDPQGWWTPRGGGPPGVVDPQGWWTPSGGGPPGVVDPQAICPRHTLHGNHLQAPATMLTPETEYRFHPCPGYIRPRGLSILFNQESSLNLVHVAAIGNSPRNQRSH